MGETLGDLQQLALLAALRLGADGYGAEIQQELERTAGRAVTLSTVYVTMERLERRGYVRSWLGDATPVRGGKPKRYYALTAPGLAALRQAHEEMTRMWRGLESHPAFGQRTR